jgi:spore maturation protein SpmB
MPPAPPVDLAAVILTALLNPAVVVVAFWMGRNADQPQKLPVAAFAAALAGSLLMYLAVWLGITGIKQVGRAAAGAFIAQFVFGLVWAYLGHRFFRR